MSGRHLTNPRVDASVIAYNMTPRELHAKGLIDDHELAASEGRRMPTRADFEAQALRERIPRALAARLAVARPDLEQYDGISQPRLNAIGTPADAAEIIGALRDKNVHYAPDLEAHARSFNIGWATHVEQNEEFDAADTDETAPEDVDLDPVAERVAWWPKPIIFDDVDGLAAVVILTRPGIGYSGYDGMIVTSGHGILNVSRRPS